MQREWADRTWQEGMGIKQRVTTDYGRWSPQTLCACAGAIRPLLGAAAGGGAMQVARCLPEAMIATHRRTHGRHLLRGRGLDPWF